MGKEVEEEEVDEEDEEEKEVKERLCKGGKESGADEE